MRERLSSKAKKIKLSLPRKFNLKVLRPVELLISKIRTTQRVSNRICSLLFQFLYRKSQRQLSLPKSQSKLLKCTLWNQDQCDSLSYFLNKSQRWRPMIWKSLELRWKASTLSWYLKLKSLHNWWNSEVTRFLFSQKKWDLKKSSNRTCQNQNLKRLQLLLSQSHRLSLTNRQEIRKSEKNKNSKIPLRRNDTWQLWKLS